MTPRTGLRSRPLFWLAMLVLAIAVAGGGFGIWYLFFRPSGPPPVDIAGVPLPTVAASAGSTAAAGSASARSPSAAPSAASTASAGSTTAASPSSAAASPSSGGASAATSGGLDGTWKVDTSLGSFSDFTSSFVGYRVQEQLASIGANTAVGRTPDVTGSFTIQGAIITAGEFTADLTTLKSDDDRRDGQLRRQGIQTAQFPTATFRLTAPIDLGTLPADGQSIQTTATGGFTLHGVTKSVQIPLQARRSGNVIVVTGSLPIVFADYGIPKPSSFVVLSIDDNGIMEVQLLFSRQ